MKNNNFYLVSLGLVCILSIFINYTIQFPKWLNLIVAIIQFTLIYLMAKSKESK